MLRGDAGERRSQIVAQRKPAGRFLPSEHAFVRLIDIRKKLPERIQVLNCRGLKSLKAVFLEHLGDRPKHLRALGDFISEIIPESFGRLSCWPTC